MTDTDLTVDVDDLDLVILDVDGVLVDVSDSYHRAIVETIERIHGVRPTAESVAALKRAGGFNDDWELTKALALYHLARREGYHRDPARFADAVEAGGGGLRAARAAVTDALAPDARERVLAAWDREALVEAFQALYLGSDRYRRLEGATPPFEADGFIDDEPTIVTPATLAALAAVPLGVVTGRPQAEARIALRRVGLSVPEDRLYAMEDGPGKPAPDGLIAVAAAADATTVVFVGDTTDDVRAVHNARERDPDRTYRAVGVESGGFDRDRLVAAGADAVVSDVNDLPARLDLATATNGTDDGTDDPDDDTPIRTGSDNA